MANEGVGESREDDDQMDMWKEFEEQKKHVKTLGIDKVL
jgi:hypothetical protein